MQSSPTMTVWYWGGEQVKYLHLIQNIQRYICSSLESNACQGYMTFKSSPGSLFQRVMALLHARLQPCWWQNTELLQKKSFFIGCLVVKRQAMGERARESACRLCTDKWAEFRCKWIKSHSQRCVSESTRLLMESVACDWTDGARLQLTLEGISVLGVLGYSTPLGAVLVLWWLQKLLKDSSTSRRACTKVLLLFPRGVLKPELLTMEEMSVICFWTCGESWGNRSMTAWFAQVI